VKKYTKAEGQARVLSPEQHKEVEKGLKRLGKTSASELTKEEREEISRFFEVIFEVC
jgi:hypothetical protein